MSASLRAALLRWLLSLMLAVGLILPVLGVLSLGGTVPALAAAALITGLPALSSLLGHRRWIPAAVFGAGLAVWLAAGGVDLCRDTVLAVYLHTQGVETVLAMQSAAPVLIASLLALLVCPLFFPNAEPAAPMLPLLLCLGLVWLTDRADLLPAMIPAAAAAIAQLALGNHREAGAARVLATALAVAAAAILLIPASGLVVDPLKDEADRIRQAILDRFFFTGSRSVFSLSSEGYYPHGLHQMGGPANPTDHPVMEVRTERTVYLRGAIFNEYTGRSWQDTAGGTRSLWSSQRSAETRSAVFDMDLPGGHLSASSLTAPRTISVTMLTGSASTLFVPQRLRAVLQVSDGLVPYFNNASELFITRDLEEGDSWTVSAAVFAWDDGGLSHLVEAAAAADDPRYDEIIRVYTALPGHLQQELFDFARSAVRKAETPFEKAIALQRWIASRCTYKLDIPDQDPRLDFVADFLLLRRTGYCVHFASALTVLCRMVGLPARYVEGYLAVPGPDGTAHVTGLNAHAWTEVYFSGFGWVPFDAAAVSGLPSSGGGSPQPPQPPEATPTPEPTSEPTPTPTPDQTPEPDDGSGDSAPTPTPPGPDDSAETPAPSDEPELDHPEVPEAPAGGHAGLWWLLLLLLVLPVLRVLLTHPKRAAARCREETARWSVWAQAVSDQLHVLHIVRRPDESPAAFLRRAAGETGCPALAHVGEIASIIFYGASAPMPEETAMTAGACQSLRGRMKTLQRLRWRLRLAFMPRRMRDFTR